MRYKIKDMALIENNESGLDFLSSNVPFPSLTDEMRWYFKKKHAEIVYGKCVKAKKYKLAMKIAYKYGLQDESKNDDTVNSFALALMFMK